MFSEQELEYRAQLINSAFSLIENQDSNPDELRYVLNLLYPQIPEFATPFIPTLQNRMILLGHLAHKLYFQLTLADPYHPYNDMLNLKPIVFAQINNQLAFLEYNMQANYAQAQYQQYVSNFVYNNGRYLEISQNSVEFGLDSIEQHYANPDLDFLYKARAVLELGSMALLIKLLILVVNGQVLLPHPEVEKIALDLNQIIDTLQNPKLNEKGMPIFLYEEDIELFSDLAIKGGEQHLVEKLIILLSKLRKPPLLILDKQPEPLLILDKQPEPLPAVLIAKDKEYSAQEIQDRIAKVQKNAGKYSEKPEKIELFMRTATADVTCWLDALKNPNILVRFKKLMLELILEFPLEEYAKAAMQTDYLAVARAILDQHIVRDKQLFAKFEAYDIAATLGHVPDGTTILHHWARIMPENTQALAAILTKYYKTADNEVYWIKHDAETFLSILAGNNQDVRERACDVLLSHAAFGVVACREAMLKAITTLDNAVVSMLCNHPAVKVDAEMIVSAVGNPFCNEVDVLDSLYKKYNAQRAVDPSLKPLQDLYVDSLDLLAIALFKSRNIAQAKYLIAAGHKTNRVYLAQNFNLAQIAVLRLLDLSSSAIYTLQVLQLIDGKPDEIKKLLSAVDDKGLSCLKYAVMVSHSHRSDMSGDINMLNLIAYLLEHDPEILTNTAINSNILHIVAEYKSLSFMIKIADYVQAVYGDETLETMLRQKNLHGHTPMHKAGDATSIISFIVTRIKEITARKKASELSATKVSVVTDLQAWAQHTPQDLDLLDILLAKFIQQQNLKSSHNSSIEELVKSVADNSGNTFLDALIMHPMSTVIAALDRMQKTKNIDIFMLIFISYDANGDNLYVKIERLPDNQLVLQKMQQIVMAFILELFVEHPGSLIDAGIIVDFFGLKRANSYVQELVAARQYAKLQQLVEQRMDFRLRLEDGIVEGIARAYAARQRSKPTAEIAGNMLKSIAHPVFGKHDLIDIERSGKPLVFYLLAELEASSNNLELKAFVASDGFKRALTMQPPTDRQEWLDLLHYENITDIEDPGFKSLQQKFKNCVVANGLNINALDASQNNALSQAASCDSLILLKFLVEECGAIVDETFMIWAIREVKSIECLEYIGKKYDSYNKNSNNSMRAIIKAESLNIVEKIALKNREFGKVKWLIQHDADSISLIRNGFNMLHIAIGMITSTTNRFSMQETLEFIAAVVEGTKDKKALMAAKDHYGYTCLGEAIVTKVSSVHIADLNRLVASFLDLGASVDDIFLGKQNMLHLAAHAALPEVTKSLVNHIRLKHGPEKVKQLLKGKANGGRTPLHLAAIKSCDVVELFLEHGADRTITDDQHLKALALVTPANTKYLAAAEVQKIKAALEAVPRQDTGCKARKKAEKL